MRNKKRSIDDSLQFIFGGILGISAIIIRIIGDGMAIILFPDYSFFKNMISDLGVGPGSFFFNFGLIISGLVLVPFFLILADYLKMKMSLIN